MLGQRLSMLFSIGAQENERGDVRELKQELLALMLAMHQRIQSLETLQDQQNSAIQVHQWPAWPGPEYLSQQRGSALSLKRCMSRDAGAARHCRMVFDSGVCNAHAGLDEGPGSLDRPGSRP